MLQFKKYINKNKKSSGYNKVYARAVVNETFDLDQLAKHMANHNTPFSKGAIKGVLTDMVACIRELTLSGVAVKIPDLAIFSLGIGCTPADKVEDFTANGNIKRFKLRARATGDFSKKELDTVAHATEMTKYGTVETTSAEA